MLHFFLADPVHWVSKIEFSVNCVDGFLGRSLCLVSRGHHELNPLFGRPVAVSREAS